MKTVSRLIKFADKNKPSKKTIISKLVTISAEDDKPNSQIEMPTQCDTASCYIRLSLTHCSTYNELREDNLGCTRLASFLLEKLLWRSNSYDFLRQGNKNIIAIWLWKVWKKLVIHHTNIWGLNIKIIIVSSTGHKRTN